MRDQLASPPVRLGLSWLGGHAAVGLLAWAVSLAGPFSVRAPSVLMPVLAVPLLGLVLAQPRLVGPLTERTPVAIRRAIGPGLKGVAALLVVGSLLVAGLVVLHLGRVLHVHSQPGPELGVDVQDAPEVEDDEAGDEERPDGEEGAGAFEALSLIHI